MYYKKILTFDYDAMGNRIAKHIETASGTRLSSTYYILDAQGNPLAMYELDYEVASFELTERQIYGSARLGSLKTKVDVFGTAYTAFSDVITTHAIGDRNYELSNHLGNVLTVVSDKLHALDNGNGVVSGFSADLVMSCDYSPFGVTLDGRGVEGSYRFGFNSMEADDEMKGDGNSYDFGARMYDSRVGRWLTIDPLQKKFPGISPYNFSYNSPIVFNDPDGRNARITIDYETNTVTFESTIYLYSTNPEINLEDMAKRLNDLMLSSNVSHCISDPNNPEKTWTVTMNVNFVFDDCVQENAIKMGLGESTSAIGLSFDALGVNPEDNLMNVNPNLDFCFGEGPCRTQGLAQRGGNLGSSNGEDKACIHETGHLLGFDERYLVDPFPMSYSIFETDFMSNTLGKMQQFMPFHFVDILDAGINISEGNSTSHILESCYSQWDVIEIFENGYGVSHYQERQVFSLDSTERGQNVDDYENKENRVCD